MIDIREVGAVAHQAAGFDMTALEVGHGKRMGRRQGHNPRALGDEERVRTDEQGFGPPARESRERRVDLPAGAGVEDLDVEAERAANDRRVPFRRLGGRHIGRIDQHGNALAPGQQLVQQCQSLRHQPGQEEVKARDVSGRLMEARYQTHLHGVPPLTKTIGMLCVERLAASAAGGPEAKITAT